MRRSDAGRRALALVLFCAVATAAHSQSLEAGTGGAHGPRPLIEKSVLIAPETVDGFTLEGSSFDPGDKQAGAGFRYALDGHQEMRVDVYVYPAGRLVEADALQAGMTAFKASFSAAEKAGVYRDLTVIDEGAFPLDPPHAEATPATSAPNVAAAGEDDEKSEAIRALLEGTRHEGRRVRLRMAYPPLDTPLNSDGYLFYKNLYFFKVRASAARDRIDEAVFHTLADGAARALVPAIEVVNIGGCASSVIEIDTRASADDMARALVTQSVAAADDNCFTDDASAEVAAKSQNASTVEITFDPGDWDEP